MSSRIQKSIINAKANVIFYVISVVLAFFSRKFFLDNLGTEFVGLSGTLGDMLNLLNLMNITELGIGTAVAVTLYKPIFDQDREQICDIISVFGYLYTRVGALIGCSRSHSVVLLPDDVMFHSTDLIEKLISEGKKVVRFPLNGTWIDIGNPQEYQKANELVKHML